MPAKTASCGTCATLRRPCCATSIPSPRSTATRPALPLGAMVTPGTYKVRLTVNGRTLRTAAHRVAMDPRVDVSNEALSQQLDLEQKIIDLVADSYDFYQKAVAFRQTSGGRSERTREESRADAGRRRAEGVRPEGRPSARRRWRLRVAADAAARRLPAFAALNRTFGSLASVVDGQDAAPTPVMQTAYEGYCRDLATAAQQWNELMKTDLAALNEELAKQKVGAAPAATLPVPSCTQ